MISNVRQAQAQLTLVAACINLPPRCLLFEWCGSKQPRQVSFAGGGPRKGLLWLRPSTGSESFAVVDVVELIEDVVSLVVAVIDLVLVAVEEDDEEEDDDVEELVKLLLLVLELLVVDDNVDKLVVDELVPEVDVVVLFVLVVMAVEVREVVLVDEVVVLVDITVDLVVVAIEAGVVVLVDDVVLVDVTVDVIVIVPVVVVMARTQIGARVPSRVTCAPRPLFEGAVATQSDSDRFEAFQNV